MTDGCTINMSPDNFSCNNPTVKFNKSLDVEEPG